MHDLCSGHNTIGCCSNKGSDDQTMLGLHSGQSCVCVCSLFLIDQMPSIVDWTFRQWQDKMPLKMRARRGKKCESRCTLLFSCKFVGPRVLTKGIASLPGHLPVHGTQCLSERRCLDFIGETFVPDITSKKLHQKTFWQCHHHHPNS